MSLKELDKMLKEMEEGILKSINENYISKKKTRDEIKKCFSNFMIDKEMKGDYREQFIIFKRDYEKLKKELGIED